MRHAVMERSRLQDGPRFAEAAATDIRAESKLPPAPTFGPVQAKLDPLVEALGLAVARKATRERPLSAA